MVTISDIRRLEELGPDFGIYWNGSALTIRGHWETDETDHLMIASYADAFEVGPPRTESELADDLSADAADMAVMWPALQPVMARIAPLTRELSDMGIHQLWYETVSAGYPGGVEGTFHYAGPAHDAHVTVSLTGDPDEPGTITAHAGDRNVCALSIGADMPAAAIATVITAAIAAHDHDTAAA